QQHDRELALLDVLLHERLADARRHVPVDVAHVVARLVLPHLGELHALTTENGVVLATEDRRYEAARSQLDQPHLAQYFARHDRFPRRQRRRGGHRDGRGAPAQKRQRAHGTSMAAKIRSTMSSDVTSSASASKLVMMRWRSTS